MTETTELEVSKALLAWAPLYMYGFLLGVPFRGSFQGSFKGGLQEGFLRVPFRAPLKFGPVLYCGI